MYDGVNTVASPCNVGSDKRSIAEYGECTAGNLKEANLVLDELFNKLFGPSKEKMVDVPPVPIECLTDRMSSNAEQSRVVLSRIVELRERLFG